MALKLSIPQRMLPIAILLFLCTITAPTRAERSFDINPNPSPEASTSLICPNDIPLECYPALFQPAIHFQKIRPGQSLPPGLHVRMNIQTGEKEARFNVPDESEGDRPEALTIIDHVTNIAETSLGIVDEENNLLHLRLQDTPKQAQHAKPFSPRHAGPLDPDESDRFGAALSTIMDKFFVTGEYRVVLDSEMADSLEALTELSHSYDWGMTICRNSDFMSPLVRLIFDTSDKTLDRLKLRSAALLLLATSIQNNPDALDALVNTQEVFHSEAELVSMIMKIIEHDGAMVHEGEGPDITLPAREILLLSRICAHESMMHSCFHLTAHDPERVEAFPSLWRLFSASQGQETKGGMKLRHRISNFVEDHVEYFVDHRTFHEAPSEEASRKLNGHDSLQPWCKALHSDSTMYEKDESFGFLQAEREVSRALEKYTGKGCSVSIDRDQAKEL